MLWHSIIVVVAIFGSTFISAESSPFACQLSAKELQHALHQLPHALVLHWNSSTMAHECLSHKRKRGAGLAFHARKEDLLPWIFETPLTRQFTNPYYRPRLHPDSHPGCLFALNASAVDWSHLTVMIVPTVQRDASPVSPASVWLVDMSGRVVLQKDTIFRGNLRAHRMINSTALMAMVDCYLAEARPQPIILWVWDIATNEEEVLLFDANIPPHHGAAHHDFTYNPNTNTILVMYRFMNRDYDPSESGSLFMERLLEFTWDGKLLWHWDAHEHIKSRHLHEADKAEKECQEHASADCWDVFHGNTVFWDVREEGTGDGIIYYNSRHLDTFWKIDKRSKRVLWALGPHGNFTQYNVTGQRRHSLLSHAHAVEPYHPNEYVLFDNNYATAEPSQYSGSRMVLIRVDEVQKEAHEVLAWGWHRQSHQAGNALMLPNGNFVGMYTTQRMVVEADPVSGQLVWGYHIGLRHHTTLYRFERLAMVPTVRLLSDVPATPCPHHLTFELFDVFRPRVIAPRPGNLSIYRDIDLVESIAFSFGAYWLPTNVTISLPDNWCTPSGEGHILSVAVATDDNIGGQWPLTIGVKGDLELVQLPLEVFVQQKCGIPIADWTAARHHPPRHHFPAPRQWPSSLLKLLTKLMSGPTVV